MPAVSVFIDSNVLLYGRDRNLSDKAELSNQWIRALAARGIARANLQVYNEVTEVMLRKRKDLSPSEVFASVDEIAFLGLSPLSEQTVHRARQIRLNTAYSWWDCLLLASAIQLGCTHFLSEDLQDGQRIVAGGGRGLTIIDPFAHSPDQILVS